MSATHIHRELSGICRALIEVDATEDLRTLVGCSARTVYRLAEGKNVDPATLRAVMEVVGQLGLLEDDRPTAIYRAAKELREMADEKRAKAAIPPASREKTVPPEAEVRIAASVREHPPVEPRRRKRGGE